MIEVLLNGERRQLAEGMTLLDLANELATNPRGIAFALDREVVPRSLWPMTELVDGVAIEVVTAVAGG